MMSFVGGFTDTDAIDMLQTNFHGSDVVVLNDAWNGRSEFVMEPSIIRDTTAGLTKREARRPYSEKLRSRLAFQVTLKGAALRAVQGSLRVLDTEPVIVPLWSAIGYWENRNASLITGGLQIVWKQDWSQYAIYTVLEAEPAWPAAADYWAPVLMGFLTPTELVMLSPDAATWDIDFTESSPADYALVFAPEREAILDAGGAAILDAQGNKILGF